MCDRREYVQPISIDSETIKLNRPDVTAHGHIASGFTTANATYAINP